MTIRDEQSEVFALQGTVAAYTTDAAACAAAILARYDLVPKGSVVVPEEPTPQMERAGADCFGALGENPDARYEVSVMYRAMLAARPRSLP